MNILAIDTATSILSLALFCEGNTWSFEADAGLRHSELVMDGIDLLTAKAGIAPEGLQGILCMDGPGSFTGLRIGFSVAKGLALSLGIPFAAVSTLQCMAKPHSAWPGLVMPAIDARKNAFFTALFSGEKRLCPDSDAEPDFIAQIIGENLNAGHCDFNKVLLAGPDAEKLYEVLQAQGGLAGVLALAPETKRGYARALIEIGQNTQIFQKDNGEWLFKGPQYIRKSDAELNAGL